MPWENVFVYGDIEKANTFFPLTGFIPRFCFTAVSRLAVKLDFIAGLLMKAVEATGTKDFRGMQAQMGEVLAWRNMLWGADERDGARSGAVAGGHVLPNMDYAMAYRLFSTIGYPRVKEIVEQTVSSGLIYINSNARDFKNPENPAYLDRYVRGSDGTDSVQRVKLMKLLWDAIGSEFGGRHELYERNYSGNAENIRMEVLFSALATGQADRLKGFAEHCMAEYDLDGWTAPDLVNPDDVSSLYAADVSENGAQQIDPAEYRRALGRFASGITVVTTSHDGHTHGMTANGLMSVWFARRWSSFRWPTPAGCTRCCPPRAAATGSACSASHRSRCRGTSPAGDPHGPPTSRSCGTRDPLLEGARPTSCARRRQPPGRRPHAVRRPGRAPGVLHGSPLVFYTGEYGRLDVQLWDHSYIWKPDPWS